MKWGKMTGLGFICQKLSLPSSVQPLQTYPLGVLIPLVVRCILWRCSRRRAVLQTGWCSRAAAWPGLGQRHRDPNLVKDRGQGTTGKCQRAGPTQGLRSHVVGVRGAVLTCQRATVACPHPSTARISPYKGCRASWLDAQPSSPLPPLVWSCPCYGCHQRFHAPSYVFSFPCQRQLHRRLPCAVGSPLTLSWQLWGQRRCGLLFTETQIYILGLMPVDRAMAGCRKAQVLSTRACPRLTGKLCPG